MKETSVTVVTDLLELVKMREDRVVEMRTYRHKLCRASNFLGFCSSYYYANTVSCSTLGNYHLFLGGWGAANGNKGTVIIDIVLHGHDMRNTSNHARNHQS